VAVLGENKGARHVYRTSGFSELYADFEKDLAARGATLNKALKDDRKGQHSIRINSQWRLCFVWTQDGAADVEIVDYH